MLETCRDIYDNKSQLLLQVDTSGNQHPVYLTYGTFEVTPKKKSSGTVTEVDRPYCLRCTHGKLICDAGFLWVLVLRPKINSRLKHIFNFFVIFLFFFRFSRLQYILLLYANNMPEMLNSLPLILVYYYYY